MPTDADIQALFEWQRTPAFAENVARLDCEAGVDLLTSRSLKPLREALILRDFATTLGFAECRLCPSDFPDGEVRNPRSKERQVEITEVLTPGRKRDEEYRRFKHNPSESKTAHHEWEEVEQSGSNWIAWMLDGVKKKLKYDKNSQFDIVVYNNIDHLWELPDILKLSAAVGALMIESGYPEHWVWQVRATTVDLLWPRVLRLRIPNWQDRF